jgi:hypothetical protein
MLWSVLHQHAFVSCNLQSFPQAYDGMLTPCDHVQPNEPYMCIFWLSSFLQFCEQASDKAEPLLTCLTALTYLVCYLWLYTGHAVREWLRARLVRAVLLYAGPVMRVVVARPVPKDHPKYDPNASSAERRLDATAG